MSKEEAGCKLAPVYKHKERKPKKPHYIPRPWGKPYNYKCFQCPFTCMEKSHLYNHMKYSLCKNSLSLLIESDWSYKKGHLLHPQLRLVQATETPQAGGQRDLPDNCDAAMVGTTSPKDGMARDGPGSRPPGKGDATSSERMNEKTSPFQEGEEEEDVLPGPLQDEKKEKVKETQSMDPDVNSLLFQFKTKQDAAGKDHSPDFTITEVFSLKKHASKGKERASLELDPKPKHCKVAKKCPGSSEGFTEQWKLVTNGQKRSPVEVLMPGADGNIIPCYPPPAYGECHESQGLNLSLVGINYPLAPNLFSYLSPSVNNSVASHAHLAQLPFLTSAAHLIHPPSAHFQPLQNSERSACLPRFYYPLLFDRSFTSVDGKVPATKPHAQPLPVMALPAPLQVQTSTEPIKGGLLKVPVLKTALPWMKSFCEEPLPEQSPKRPLDEEEKWLVQEKEGCSLLAAGQLCRNTPPDAFPAPMGVNEVGSFLPNSFKKAELPGAACLDRGGTFTSHLKKKVARSGLDVKGSSVATPEKVTYQGSSGLQATPMPSSKPMDHWQVELHGNISEVQEKIRSSDILSPMITAISHPFVKSSNEPAIIIGPRDEKTTVLLGELSKTLEEYQEVEKKLSNLANEDTPGQEHLRDQLVKIRHELFHIHQTLEKATKSNEGPLDLSVKRSSKNMEKEHQDKKEPKAGIQDGKVQGKDPGSTNRYFEVGGQEKEASDCPLETENKTIDLLIKMSHSKNLRNSSSETHLGAMIKAEGLPHGAPLEFRRVVDPYYSHTTKCEADSSVLLCTDGRSNASQGLPLPVTEDAPQGYRTIPPHSLTCSLPCETDKV